MSVQVPSIPDRATSVTFDDHHPSVVNPPLYLERTYDEMVKTPGAETTNIQLVQEVGWRLKSYQVSSGNLVELSAAQSGILGLSQWDADSNIVEFDSFRQNPWTGLSYASGVQTAGSPVMQKRVAAGSSFNGALSVDAAAYPAPDTGADTQAMDRTLVLKSNHSPTDSLTFRFYVPGPALFATGPLITLYFCGPAGTDDSGTGVGQYALKFLGDGVANLYELTDSGTWLLRHFFSWAHPQSVYGNVHFITIDNDATGAAGFPGSKILMAANTLLTSKGSIGQMLGSLTSLAIGAVRASNLTASGFLYHLPGGGLSATVQAPLRVDVRRDVRAIFQVSKAVYPTSGVLFDDIVSMEFLPTVDEPFYSQVWGDIPSGTSLNIQLFEPDGTTELSSPVSTYSSSQVVEKRYTPTLRSRHLRVKISYSSDGTASPTVRRWNIFRDPVFETPVLSTVTGPAKTNLQKYGVRSVGITGPRKESGEDGAGFNFDDQPADVTRLKTRGGLPVKIETEYNGAGDKSVLFRGYTVTSPRSKHIGYSNGIGDTTNYADRYSVSCDGEWHRLFKALAPMRYRWIDEQDGYFFKITTIIRSLLLAAYPSSMVSVPDIDIRPFGNDSEAMILEPGTAVADVCIQFASQYLGAYLLFDANAGTRGKWRLMEQKVAPYTPLARFYKSAPSGKLSHVVAAYGTSTSGSQTVLHGYCQKGTFEDWVEEPEGNAVMVFGGSSNESGSEAGGTARLSQIALNVNSFNPFNVSSGSLGYPDTTDPDYLGHMVPIQVVDATLTTQSAVDWTCRRIYDYACHARKYVAFTGPLLLVTDASDSEQTNPRPLRVYDIVELEEDDGSFEEYIVVSCDPVIEKDSYQMARYQLVRPSNMSEKATLPPKGSLRDMFMRIAKVGMGAAMNIFMGSDQGRQTVSGLGGAMVLPEAVTSPLQDLDPASGTYGDFYFMPDFDGIL